jgi:hypothetical protein
MKNVLLPPKMVYNKDTCDFERFIEDEIEYFGYWESKVVIF